MLRRHYVYWGQEISQAAVNLPLEISQSKETMYPRSKLEDSFESQKLPNGQEGRFFEKSRDRCCNEASFGGVV